MQHVTLSTEQCKQCGRYLFASESKCYCYRVARRDRMAKAIEITFAVAWLVAIVGWRVWEVMT